MESEARLRADCHNFIRLFRPCRGIILIIMHTEIFRQKFRLPLDNLSISSAVFRFETNPSMSLSTKSRAIHVRYSMTQFKEKCKICNALMATM
jgi:hypothetical protein